MMDRSELLKFLEIAQRRIENQHSVLWKVETHYTWLVYIIAGGIAATWLAPTNLTHENLLLISGFVSVLGLALSLLGYYVIRLEGEYLYENLQIYNRTVTRLPDLRYLHPEQGIEVKEWDEVKSTANKCFGLLLASVILSVVLVLFHIPLCRKGTGRLSGWLRKFRLGVRDVFQLTLLLAAALFLSIIVLSFIPAFNKLILNALSA